MSDDEIKAMFGRAKEVMERINDNEAALRLLIVDSASETKRRLANREELPEIERAALVFADRLAPLIAKRARLASEQAAVMYELQPYLDAIINSGDKNADKIYLAMDLYYIQGMSAKQAGVEMGFCARQFQRFIRYGNDIINNYINTRRNNYE